MNVDLTAELARLISFTGNVATAIRMYSAYNQCGSHEDAGMDLMWLSDSLHSFGTLGQAIHAGNAQNIISACDLLIKTYSGYQVIRPSSSRQALPTFERNAARVNLNEGISIFTNIRAKVVEMEKGRNECDPSLVEAFFKEAHPAGGPYFQAAPRTGMSITTIIPCLINEKPASLDRNTQKGNK